MHIKDIVIESGQETTHMLVSGKNACGFDLIQKRALFKITALDYVLVNKCNSCFTLTFFQIKHVLIPDKA